jgi:hypothetical protein
MEKATKPQRIYNQLLLAKYWDSSLGFVLTQRIYNQLLLAKWWDSSLDCKAAADYEPTSVLVKKNKSREIGKRTREE